jgi:AcrR family transcriptional regulator
MRENIKDAAVDLFYKKGYFATSMSQIAKKCGIRKASIYHHYTNKEDILFDILLTTMTLLEVSLEKALSSVSDEENKMRAAVAAHIDFHIDNQKKVLISDSELRGLTTENYKIIIKMRDRYEKTFQSLIKACIDKKIFNPEDIKILSYAVLTMCTAVAFWFKPSGRLKKEEISKIYTKFAFDGLRNGKIPLN